MWRWGLWGRDVELSTIPRQHQSEDRLINSPSEESNAFRKDAPVQQHQQPLDGERFQGWRFTIFLAFITSLVVLLLNLGFLLCTVAHHQQKDQKGTLYQGDCVKVQHMSTGFHLLVNVLSTALLAASNFGMQCLCAPTRQNIDRAHQQGKWLDIGVPSIRNLFRVSPWRFFLWLCLASSSLPFHLMYNSTIFSTTSAMEYNIFLGKGSLGQKPLSNLHITAPGSEFRASFEGLHASAQNGTLQRLDNTQCVDAFAQTFQTTYSNLLLVTDDVKENDTYLYFTTQEVFNPYQYLLLPQPQADPYRWLCPGDLFDDCSTYLPTVRSQIAHNNWTVTKRPYGAISWKVNYCLAEKGRQLCKLQYSFPLIMLIIGFNLVKTCILCYMWLGIRDAPLLTIGDAIASFLHRSDPTTQGACLLTRRRAQPLLRKRSLHQPEKYTAKRRRWGAAASVRRWMFSIILWLIAITGCIILLVYGIHNVQYGTSAWKLSLGAVNATTLIKGDNWPSSLIPIVIIANMPQLIFSFLYFASNALLTAMNVAAEWSGFAVQRKGLRVSSNRALAQRRYYFLSLPYRYAVPLIAASAVLHWLISQSLFMVGVEAYDYNMLRLAKRDVVTCGYSPVAIVCAIAVGGSMFLCTLGLGFRRVDSAMPVAGSCSLAIAAACHPAFDPNGRGGAGDGDAESEYGDEDMGLLPVKWGAVPVDGRIGHCSFTAGEVETPVDGQLYQ